MVYSKQTWVDDSTPLSALRLNNMEQGIANAAVLADFPLAFIRQSVAQNSLANAWIAMTLNVADIDTHSGWSPASPTKWTVPAGQGGTYLLSGTLSANTTSTPLMNGARLAKNGTVLVGSLSAAGTYTSTTQPGVSSAGPRLTVLAAGDYIELQGWVAGANWGTFVGVDATTFLQIQRVR